MVQQQMPTRRAGNIHVVGGNQLHTFSLNTTGNSFHIPAVRIATRVLMISFFLSLSGLGCVRNPTPTEPVLVELTRVIYEQETAAIVTELVIPGVEEIKQLSRIELLLSRVDEAGDEVATFAVMLNHSDRVDPIPPGNFGVITDPASDDRSIKNVASAAGLPGRFDHVSANGILLKQSVSSVVNGNLGISIWIVPRDWAAGRYTIQIRAIKGKHQQAPWQQLGEFSYTGH